MTPNTISSQWVGGGSVLAPARPSNDLGYHESEEQKTLYATLPDVIRIPLVEAVSDVELDGWEDDWFAHGRFDVESWGPLEEPKIDFVYNWVNGSDEAFRKIRRQYELKSPLNDDAGKWISRHGTNRYRDWGELRYSLRSLDRYAARFINKIQILVNSVAAKPDGTGELQPQRPSWLRNDPETDEHVQVLSQEAFFHEEERRCLPTFNSLAIESEIYMTPSTTDRLVALSDDMFLGMPHAASDFYSPLFGSVMAFKSDHYNVRHLGSGRKGWPTFGEKPFVYYTSYLLNHRFGARARYVQAHFGHSVSRSVMHETMASFPRPAAQGACDRFRGESHHYQIYPWYAGFHYTIERFREALLWSFVITRSDTNGDGYLDWMERRMILDAVEPGWQLLSSSDSSEPAKRNANRDRMYYRLPQMLEKAGLEPPIVNVDVLWTSVDGPETIRNIKCHDFSVDKCFADSFGSPLSDDASQNTDFMASNVFSRLASQHPECGDCLIKFVLASATRGLEPLLPPKLKPKERLVVIKALKKYQHTIVDTDAMKFVMIKDADQARMELLDRTVKAGKKYGQYCLNDDVMIEDEEEVSRVKEIMTAVFDELWPERGRWEKNDA
ncbi:hypothetical protein DL769_000144 [Monosporascus sp. CRB-8-3]|nr:hypothetical protein DL769_000144 [Monosporascus sp. CRB-8-3]